MLYIACAILNEFGQLLMRVTGAELIEQWSALADRALHEPLTVTKDGRDRLVVISVDEYARLKGRDRRAMLAEELTDEEAALIAQAEVPAEYAYLDALLDDERS